MAHEEKKILIVEDSPEIQYLLKKFLKSEGYSVTHANNGKEALESLEQMNDLPGLIMLDLMMPVMDGAEFRREQKNRPKIAGIPVIVMTADSDIQTKSASIGVSDYLKKPFEDIDSILDAVGKFF